MIKKLVFLLFFLSIFGISIAVAQSKKIDSLKNILSKTFEENKRAHLYNLISEEFKNSDVEISLEYANKALAVSKKIKNNVEEGNAYVNLGNVKFVYEEYPLALKYLIEAQTIFENEIRNKNTSVAIKNSLGRTYGIIGLVFNQQSNTSKALIFYIKSLKIFESTGNLDKCASLYNNIGILYQIQGFDDKALEYLFKCEKIQLKIKSELITSTTSNIGKSFFYKKNYSKALEYFNKANILLEKFPNTQTLSELKLNFGEFYSEYKQYDKALANLKESMALFSSIDNQIGLSRVYNKIGAIYFEKKEYKKSLYFTKKALSNGKKINAFEVILNAEKKLIAIHEIMNNSNEALKHYKTYVFLSDSIEEDENLKNSVRVEMNYDFDKKQSLQKKEQEKRELLFIAEAKQRKTQFIFSFFGLLLLGGIVFLVYNQKQLKNTLTLQKDLIEYEQKALHLQMNPHFVFNCLGSISSFILQNDKNEAVRYLSRFSKLMRLTLEYSKVPLIPIDKEIESLENYLELEKLRFNQNFDYKITKNDDIDDDMALPSLLLQPFVENAILHGVVPLKHDGLINVDFSTIDTNLICMISDNGIGIEKSRALKKDKVTAHKSMALEITKKRLEMMEAAINKKADVQIVEEVDENKEVKGTKVIIHLPLQYL
jgi:tetratricopeptide (TPR) repeat protein